MHILAAYSLLPQLHRMFVSVIYWKLVTVGPSPDVIDLE